MKDDTISRQAAIDALRKMQTYKLFAGDDMLLIDQAEAQTELMMMPSAQPEQHLDEWCVDCKEYDKEKHSCPRWNRVIRQTLLDAQPERKTGRWIEMSSTNHTYKCSVCGRLLVNITDGKNNVAKNYPYCHCGADMRPTERNSNV